MSFPYTVKELFLKIVAMLLFVAIGFTLAKWFRAHWFWLPVAVMSLVCAAFSLFPDKFQLRISIFLRISAAMLLSFGVFLLYRRLDFILSYGGMEGPNGEGSPLAFIIGMVFEQVYFSLPSLFILWLYSKRKIKYRLAMPNEIEGSSA